MGEACVWTQGSGSKCLCIIYELQDSHGALGQSGLSSADQGPVEQGQQIIPQTSVNSCRGALLPLPVSSPQNVTLFGDSVFTEVIELK